MEYWQRISSQFDLWTSPQRPNIDDVQAFKRQLTNKKKTLLLGLTSELLPLATCAIDSDNKQVKQVGNLAINGMWENIPFTEVFDAVIGDGSLTVFQENPQLLFEQAFKALKPGGIFILRVFIAPEKKEDLDTIKNEQHLLSYHAFKWRVAHALADPYVPVKDLYAVLQPICDHPTLEVYKDTDVIYYFPKLSDLPKWETIHFNDSYELANRCPIITWRKH